MHTGDGSPSHSSASHTRADSPLTPGVVRGAVALYGALLRLCPRDFRRHFGPDMVQVFRQLCRDAYANRSVWGVIRITPSTLGDLAVGAAAEYLVVFLTTWKESRMIDRLRTSAITVFCAFVAFVVAGITYQRLTEPLVQSGLQDAHPLLAISFLVIQIGAVIAVLAVLIGGVPIAFASLRSGISARRWDIPALFAVPVVAFAALASYVAFVVHGASSHGPTPSPLALYAGGLVAIFVLGAIASAWAVSAAISRAQVGDRLVRFTRLPAVVTTLAMGLMLVATLTYGIGLLKDAPQVFRGAGLFATNPVIGWSAVLVAMVIATIVAAIGLWGSMVPPRTPVAATA